MQKIIWLLVAKKYIQIYKVEMESHAKDHLASRKKKKIPSMFFAFKLLCIISNWL